MEKREFTAAEAARILHVPEKKVIKLADDGELAGQKVQGQWLFSKADMILWFEKTLTDAKSDDHLEHIEKLAEDVPQADEEPGLPNSLPAGVLIPFPAKTRDSVIHP